MSHLRRSAVLMDLVLACRSASVENYMTFLATCPFGCVFGYKRLTPRCCMLGFALSALSAD
jgi:hypothetical protein